MTFSALALSTSLLLTSCGGGGSSPGGASSLLTGTVAVGAPIAGATITARDVNGKTSNSVTADENGKYEGLDLSGLAPPILIEATGQIGQTPYKLYTPLASPEAGTANVTSLTTALAGVLGGGDPQSMSLSAITASGLTSAKTLLSTALAPLASTLGLNLGSTDLISASFTANNTGLDKLLDLVDVRVRTEGISMVNRLQPVGEDQVGADRSELRIGLDGQISGTLPSGQDVDLGWLQTMASDIGRCFALPAAQRVTYNVDAGGVAIPTNVHPTCKAFVGNNYLTNSYTFEERWIFALKDPAFDNAKFRLQLAYINNDNASTAYVVNLHTQDSSGNGYTRPEVVTKVGNEYKLTGNQRALDLMVQPLIAKISTHENIASSSNLVAGRLSFFFTPHRDYDSSTSTHKYFYSSNKPQPKWVCAWVTGPALPGEGAMNGTNTGPLGGILLKVPRSDYVAQRSYMAVHVKFPATFDPTAVQSDRNQLLKACAARENASTNGTASFEAASWSTFNFFTIDAAKTDQSSTFSWPTSASYSWAGDSTAWNEAVGTSSGNWSLAPVSLSTKATYKPTSMPLYTFHAFRHTDLPTGMYTVPGNGSIPVVDNAKGNAFFNAKTVVKTRMLGAMPYLSADANGVYNGNVRFGSVADTTLSSFLGANAPDIQSGSSLAAAWSPAAGATGIDRVGLTCYGTWTQSGNKKRWGPSVSSASWGVPRSKTSGNFTLDEDCVGLTARSFNSDTIPSTTMYRDIWVRTYDQENRQIQRVVVTER